MEGLGISLQSFVFQLINFLILLGGLTYLLHKPLLKLLETRRSEIKEGLENATQMKEEAAALEERQRQLLADANREAGTLLSEARHQAKQMEERLTQEAEGQAVRILEKATAEIERERAQMKDELREEIAELVVKATERLMVEAPEKTKREQAARLVKELS